MRKFQRLPAPGFLKEKWEEWGRDWERRHAANPSASFNWRVVEGKPVNQKLMPVLKAQTQDHCSFCDLFQVSPPSIDTILTISPIAILSAEVATTSRQ